MSKFVFAVNLFVLLGLTFAPVDSSAYADTAGYWRFEEGSGSVANDSSAFGNTGTITQADLYSTDVQSLTVPLTGAANNYSLILDGGSNPAVIANPADQYVIVADSPSLRPLSAITIEATVRLDRDVNGNAAIVNYYTAGSNSDSYSLGLRGHAGTGSNNNYPFFGVQLPSGPGSGPNAVVDLETPLVIGQWYNLVGVYDGSEVRLYVNGVLQGSASGFAGDIQYPTITSLLIGADTEVDGVTRWGFPGNLDEVRISNAELSPDQFLATVPEPSTLVLAGIGTLALATFAARRRFS